MTESLNVLCLDSEGLFEIVSGQVLTTLERQLRQKTGDPRTRLADVFHMIAGTGTGGILAALYLCPNNRGTARFSAEEVTDFLLDHGDFIFEKAQLPIRNPGGPRYTPGNLECMLNAYLGDLQMAQLIRPCLLTSFDVLRQKPYVFRSHQARLNEQENFPVTAALRAVSALPSWFGRARIEHRGERYVFQDKVIDSNPLESVLAECLLHFGKRASQINLLSLGLETTPGPCGLCHLPPGPVNRSDLLLRRLFDPKKTNGRHLRIAPSVPNHIDPCPDLATEHQLTELSRFGEQTAKEHNDALDRFATQLLAA